MTEKINEKSQEVAMRGFRSFFVENSSDFFQEQCYLLSLLLMEISFMLCEISKKKKIGQMKVTSKNYPYFKNLLFFIIIRDKFNAFDKSRFNIISILGTSRIIH